MNIDFMKISKPESLQKAIDQGKERMSHSVDMMHDSMHVINVEYIGLKILKEFTHGHEPGAEWILPEHVQIASWWHDCFKATQLRDTVIHSIKANFVEGVESERIFKHEMADTLTPDELREIGSAIRNHSGVGPIIRYFILGRSVSTLQRILLEADAWDLINPDRYIRAYSQTASKAIKAFAFLDIFESLILPFYLRTRTARHHLYRRLYRFWATWFWKEWTIIKIWYTH